MRTKRLAAGLLCLAIAVAASASSASAEARNSNADRQQGNGQQKQGTSNSGKDKSEKEDEKDNDEKDDDKKEGGEGDNSAYTYAVIGDIPYGDAQVAVFPKVVAQINADPDVRLVTHLGDIKSGSSLCSDAYFAMIRSNFDAFVDPLVYTPGDNEWTDCHRANNGAYNPLERLGAVRNVFFPNPGRTLGQNSMKVKSQSSIGFPENVRYQKKGVYFATIHIVGSNNSLVNWTGKSAPTPEQTAEYQSRTAAGIALLNATFDAAKDDDSKAVVIQVQADMFDPTLPCPSGVSVCPPVFAQWNGFQSFIQTLAARAAAYGKPVYLFDGDSHVFNVDQPLAAASAWPAKYGPGNWLTFYGVTTPAPNLTRITVDGSTGVNNWLKVTIDPRSKTPLSWRQVPFGF